MDDFKKNINKLLDLFDKLGEADITPTSNFSTAEYFMNRAIKGDVKARVTLAAFVSKSLNIPYQLVSIALEEWINDRNGLNESKRVVRLSEGNLRRIIKEAIEDVLIDQEEDYPFGNPCDFNYIPDKVNNDDEEDGVDPDAYKDNDYIDLNDSDLCRSW